MRAPQLTFCDADIASHDKLCEEFASYLFLERSAREDIQKALLNPQKQDLFRENIPIEYPIEIKYRMAIARDASYDALDEQQTRITNMIKAYERLANLTKSSDTNFMAKLHDIICNDDVMGTGAFERNYTAINALGNLAFPDSPSGTHDVALFTTLRFAYFASVMLRHACPASEQTRIKCSVFCSGNCNNFWPSVSRRSQVYLMRRIQLVG